MNAPYTSAPALDTRKLKNNFGAEILGVDLATASDEVLAAVVAEFNLHGALLVRGQTMDADALVRFASAFGQPENHTLTEYTMPTHPFVYRLSNRILNGKPIGIHNDGVGWHTDYSYKALPVMCTMLFGVECPPEGADTLVADMVAAYESLPAERKAELDPLQVHHSYQYFMETRDFNRRTLTPEQLLESPDVMHPLIRTHPTNGRKALWPSSGTVKGITGMEHDAALKLVDELVAYGTQEQFVYRHKWKEGDLLVWDNRCTMHTGTLFDDKKYIREMHRLWVKGDKPY
jgi:taurine dioxygenase